MSEAAEENSCMVSVIVPTNNRKRWAAEALRSVFSQTYSDYEVIVIDDGSTDGTTEYLREEFGERIQIFRTEGTNCPTARNFGAKKSYGKYLAFLDDDDLWYPAKLEKQVSYMEGAEETVAMVGSGCDHMDKEGNAVGGVNIPPRTLSYQVACIEPKLPGAISGCLIRARVFKEFGGFDLSLTRNQDRDLWIKIARNYEIHLLTDVLSTVRLHTTPRRGVTVDLIRDCRLEINRRIPEPKLKRQADAWTHFHLHNLYWEHKKRKAFYHLFASFLTYPLPLPIEKKRLKILVKKILRR